MGVSLILFKIKSYETNVLSQCMPTLWCWFLICCDDNGDEIIDNCSSLGMPSPISPQEVDAVSIEVKCPNCPRVESPMYGDSDSAQSV